MKTARIITKKQVLTFVKQSIIVTIIGSIVAALIYPSTFASLKGALYTATYCFFLGMSIWKTNDLVSFIIKNKVDWLKKPLRSFIISFSATSLFSFITILVVNVIWYSVFLGENFYEFLVWGKNLLFLQLGVTLIIALVIYTIVFLKGWKNSALLAEQLKREQITLQFESLKNQVNPHFLFNSLNVLSTLVYKDQEIAVKFIKKLSDVYRYVLEQKDKDTVSLSEEMKFVESYVYLLKIRHGENLKVNLTVGDNQKKIVPLSIQMLVENAVKHNIISENNPLEIDIYTDNNGFIVIKNNLHRKKTVRNSTKTGLENIKLRFSFLSDKSPEIIENDKTFQVLLPLLETN